jgi:hypothetical protein
VAEIDKLRNIGAPPECYRLNSRRRESLYGDTESAALLFATETDLSPSTADVLVLRTRYVSGAPLTRDQIALMQNDNVASSQFPGLRELGVEPTPVDAVLDKIGRRAAASG